MGAGSVVIDAVETLDAEMGVLPLTGQLRFVADDDVVLHRLGDSVDFELERRVLHGPHETQT